MTDHVSGNGLNCFQYNVKIFRQDPGHPDLPQSVQTVLLAAEQVIMLITHQHEMI